MRLLTINEVAKLDLRKKYKIIGEHKYFLSPKGNRFSMLYYQKRDMKFLKKCANTFLKPEKNNMGATSILDDLISRMMFSDAILKLVETNEDAELFNNELMLKEIEREDYPLSEKMVKQFIGHG